MKLGWIAALGFGAASMAGSAQAMPMAPAPEAGVAVEQVAQGCGPGFARGPRGFCRPMGRRFMAPPPRRFLPPPPRRFGPPPRARYYRY